MDVQNIHTKTRYWAILTFLIIIGFLVSGNNTNNESKITGEVLSEQSKTSYNENTVTELQKLEDDKAQSGNIVSDSEEIQTRDFFSNSTEPHWGHMPLSYYIHPSCGNETTLEFKKILRAFEAINNETDGIVSFTRYHSAFSDIFIECYEHAIPSQNYDEGDTVGLAWKNQTGNVITYANISLYGVRPKDNIAVAGCSKYMGVEIHEILHTFGFGHIYDVPSIMSDDTGYDLECYITKIDQDIILTLKEIYGTPFNRTSSCTSNWVSGDWSVCINGQQTRNVTDTNNCSKPTGIRPKKSQECYLPPVMIPR